MEDNKELFWGLGRTWAFGILVLIAVTIVLAIGNVTPEFWQNTVIWVFGICGGKSMAVGVANAIKKK